MATIYIDSNEFMPDYWRTRLVDGENEVVFESGNLIRDVADATKYAEAHSLPVDFDKNVGSYLRHKIEVTTNKAKLTAEAFAQLQKELRSLTET